MLLVVDVGNTNIVAGVFEDKTLKVHWRFSTDRSKTADEFGIMLRSMFAYSDVEMDKIFFRHYFQCCASGADSLVPHV